jgi:hypothetical protein
MKILALGDIMGKAGRLCLDRLLPIIRETYRPDFVIVNGENAAGGFGLTKKIYDQFVGHNEIDAVTMGNHWHDKREIYEFGPKAERLVLPANMGNVDHESMGLKLLVSRSGERVAVMNLIGRTFMKEGNRDPFKALDKLLDMIPSSIKVRILDIHAEATSEKQALAWYCAGKVSFVYGTHSHVPSGDERIIDQHTAFATDIGMTGPYGSVIGIRKDAAIHRMQTGEKKKFEPAAEDPWLCAVLAEIDPQTGAAQGITRIRVELSKHI